MLACVFKRLSLVLCIAASAAMGIAAAPPTAAAEEFYCESTRTPNGSGKYCNFLLFDRSFKRHQQVVVAKGQRRTVAINGRFDIFCVLVQDHTRVPDNIAYRKQQCMKTDTGRNYQFPIKKLNMRRGRDGYSTNSVGNVRPERSTY